MNTTSIDVIEPNTQHQPNNGLRHLQQGIAGPYEQQELAEWFPCNIRAGELTTGMEWWDSITGTWLVEHHFDHGHRVLARKRQN